MSKSRFIILNILAVLLSFLLVTRVLLLRDNEQIRRHVQSVQMEAGAGQNAWLLLQRLAWRIDQGARNEPDLKDFLKQYKINVQGGTEARK